MADHADRLLAQIRAGVAELQRLEQTGTDELTDRRLDRHRAVEHLRRERNHRVSRRETTHRPRRRARSRARLHDRFLVGRGIFFAGAILTAVVLKPGVQHIGLNPEPALTH
jgi:hypothetical protein